MTVASAPMATRRPRKAIVAVAGSALRGDRSGRALLSALRELGIETIYIGPERHAQNIAAAAAAERADAVELCLVGGGGVVLVRDILRELIRIGRRDVSIVVHRP